MKITELKTHVKKALNIKVEESEKPKPGTEKPKGEKSAAEASEKDLFGYPVEDDGLAKKALKVENDVDEPKVVEIPDSEESFSAKNTNDTTDDPDVGDEPAEVSEEAVTGTGEGAIL